MKRLHWIYQNKIKKHNMISFLTTPIFYLTPYIFLWSIANGLIAVGLIWVLKVSRAKYTLIVTAITTAIASIFWNWSVEFNQSTIYLNVDHPIFRISWADALNGVCVFALTSLVLGLWINRESRAAFVVKIAGIAALLTTFTDTFFF
jgi:fucose 4-O-acetylase-like acetyltransferase